MTKFYDILEQIKTKLLAEPFCNTVTTGSIDDIDLNKQNIFPLSHIIVNNCNVQSNTLIFNISVLAMDIVDESKKETSNIFIGNDNEQDILNTQLSILNRLIALLKRGDLYSNGYQVEGDVNCEPFVDRFENKLAGWAATLDLIVQNDMTIC